MAHPNLRLRGGSYCWRRKVVVAGHTIAISLSLRNGCFRQSRAIAARLTVALEALRMTYGERGIAIDPATLQRIFSDALRWSLTRILTDQIASSGPVEMHRETNTIFGELWRLHARLGPGAKYTAEEDERLKALGWSSNSRMALATLWWEMRDGGGQISAKQIDDYVEEFGFARTSMNLDRVYRTIYGARAAACDEASKRLGKDAADFSSWIDEALADNSPFAFDRTGTKADANQGTHASNATGPSSTHEGARARSHEAADAGQSADRKAQPDIVPAPADVPRPKKLLNDAMDECIAAYTDAKAWSADSCSQVRTAIRLFDFACGGGVFVEDIAQANVTAFVDLCKKLPNRWGRTRAEVAGGIPASLERARTMDASMVGMAPQTMAKHITWITQVLSYCAGENGEGHEPATPVSFEKARKPLGKGAAKHTRTRDKRAAWKPEEISHLLSAPIWHGCLSIDDRYSAGNQVFHDAWYWLPLMLTVYGGRSAELTGLPMSDVFENTTIPYFRIEFTELRSLKNVQSIRSLPIHPELIRLGFLDFIREMRRLGHQLVFPEMHSADSKSFAKTFYSSVFTKLRTWAYPNGTSWRHQAKGAMRDKDVHSFRGFASTWLKGYVEDSIIKDIIGHEGDDELTISYLEDAELEQKLAALTARESKLADLPVFPLNLRPAERQKFGAKIRAPSRHR